MASFIGLSKFDFCLPCVLRYTQRVGPPDNHVHSKTEGIERGSNSLIATLLSQCNLAWSFFHPLHFPVIAIPTHADLANHALAANGAIDRLTGFAGEDEAVSDLLKAPDVLAPTDGRWNRFSEDLSHSRKNVSMIQRNNDLPGGR